MTIKTIKEQFEINVNPESMLYDLYIHGLEDNCKEGCSERDCCWNCCYINHGTERDACQSFVGEDEILPLTSADSLDEIQDFIVDYYERAPKEILDRLHLRVSFQVPLNIETKFKIDFEA